ncbi:MAG: acyl carrier protein [Chloroflexia bacterium]|nr:acyl carrier protein [Chloroflexia bacterium]
MEEFEIEKEAIVPDAHLIDDLGLESLDLVDIVVIVEKEFGFKVKREDMEKIQSLENLYNYIEECIN